MAIRAKPLEEQVVVHRGVQRDRSGHRVGGRGDSRARIDAVVFDLGGVVVDWNPRHLYRKFFDDAGAMERFLEEIDFTGWNIEQDRGRPYEEGVRLLSDRFPQHRALISAYDERWEESIPGVIEGTIAILEELRVAGVPLHALTNWSAEKFEIALQRFPFEHWFDEVVVSGREGVCKPEPAIYRLLLERTGLGAERCLFIDDSPANTDGAASLGFHTHLFTSPAGLRSEMERRRLLDSRGSGTAAGGGV